MVDREQIRRDAEELLQAWTDDEGAVARHCLALLAELEQAERERDEGALAAATAMAAIVEKYEAQLAKVPALVEAMRYCARRGAADSTHARKALAAFEQEQKP